MLLKGENGEMYAVWWGWEVIAEVFFGWEKRGRVLFVSILGIDFRIRRGEI